jgi:clorobiocin biosynthesis protein CloN6
MEFSLPTLKTDLLLLHPPAFFDFRERRDIYFPFLGTSGDVPITPLYEYFPLGFKTLQRYLGDRGHDVKILNLSTVLLRFPNIKLRKLIEAIDAKLIGIDLQWMVHVQGSLSIAEYIKKYQPDTNIVFGGISATYYADELIQYPFIDMVMRGYDTHEPMTKLLSEIKNDHNLEKVPNLLWKSENGKIFENGFDYKPVTFGCGINWNHHPGVIEWHTLPILEFLCTQSAGCSFNCGWCGGSRDAFRRIFHSNRAVVRKSEIETAYEFSSFVSVPNINLYHLYTVGSYNESSDRFYKFLDLVAESNFKSISYEQFYLTPEDVLKRMIEANQKTNIILSPESHDIRISRLAGRGVYENEELEQWLEKALEIGINQVDIWYFVGMPEQDKRSVMETVEYCQHLLDKFQGQRIYPLICPMMPYLDPGSNFFERPNKHGYKLFYKSLEDHRRGMECASIINRINYETDWLSRKDLVYTGYDAIRSLMNAKAETGVLPKSWVSGYNANIDDALDFIGIVHEIDCIKDEHDRSKELENIGKDILRRNNMVFYSGVMNQSLPINRNIGGRWFDVLGWKDQDLESLANQLSQ